MEIKQSKKEIDFETAGFLFDCDSKEKIIVEIEKCDPLNMTLLAPRGSASLYGNEVIVVTNQIVMYADVISETVNRNLSKTLVLASRRFTENVYESKFLNDVEDVNFDEYDIVIDTIDEKDMELFK